MAEIRVTGPDGSTFAFPVGTPPDVISGAMSKHYGAMPRSTTGTQSGDEARANAAGDTRAKMRLEDIQSAYRVAQQRGMDAEKNLGPKSTKDLIAPELRAQSQAQYDAARKEQEAMAEAYVQRERADNPHMAITDRTRTIGRGAPVLGAAGDEINAFLNSPLSAMGLSDNGQAYQEGLDYQRARNRVFDREHPKESLGLQIGGGIASGVAAAPLIAGAPAALTSAGLPTAGRVAATAIGQNAPLAGQAVRGAIAGAATGAADSALRADNGESRSDAALTGGLIGGGVGAVAPVVAAGVGRVGEWAADQLGQRAAFRRIGVSPEAGRMLTDTARADQAAGFGAGNVTRAGPNAMAADYGPNTRGLLDATIQSGGEGSARAQAAITARAAGEGQRISQAGGVLDQAFGPAPDMNSMQTAMRQQAQATLHPLYDAAYRQPINYASPTGRQLETTLLRVPRSVMARAQNLMDVEGVQSAQRLVQIAPDGTMTVTRMPDVRQIDYVKRALQDVQRRGDGLGALGGNTNEGRAYGQLARDLRDRLGTLVPEYRRAVDTALTEIDERNALEFGADLMRRATAPGEVRAELRGMTPVERQYVTAGVRSWAEDTLANVKRTITDPSTDAREGMNLLKEFSSRASRGKLTEVLGQQQADTLFRELDDIIAPAFELRAAVAQNSKTFPRQVLKEGIDARNEPGVVGSLTMGEPVKAAKKAVQAATGNTEEFRRATSQRMIDEINHVLTHPRGAAAVQMIRDLDRATALTGQAPAIARMLRTYVTGAVAGGGYPAIERPLAIERSRKPQ